ncbi:DUF4214 domain-containing protein [Pseudomonas sp. 21LCFQ02]|uniref:DUF4214 domain-containing protein n=2 Tax=Pseudomonadota TaxID=1224 RepID=UPI0004F8B03E|nr:MULTISPECIES: DUF4214 domain-containing protein [unclassified Pseudomonas]MCO8171020.1 DUF4214 domain-containing protein [Pseudomonas sp. 21LCFQ02]MCQ9425611.1 DUF4214 domain-containing protein [Pseudomonas sp. LJDD11]BAP46039.1 allergen V5/Tpx-1 related protein [Pseudomonas sp. StFLB209]
MATITYRSPFDSTDLDRASHAGVNGQVVSANSMRIVYSDGTYKAEVSGFLGSGNPQVDKFTGVSYSKNDVVFLTVTGLDVKVADASSVTSFYDGDDTYRGSAGNDDFQASLGNDTYFGDDGIDTIHYNALSKDFTVDSMGSALSNVEGLGKKDTLFSIERVNFQQDNATVALDVGQWQNAGAAFRLYQAAFDRKPDMGGLKYWINDLDQGATIQQVAQGFVDSAEFKKLTPGTDNKSIINSFYQHVLHRDADAGGFKYWEDSMAGGMTASEVLVSFSESAENMNNTSADLNGGLWLV